MTLKEVSIGQTVTVKKLSGQGATKPKFSKCRCCSLEPPIFLIVLIEFKSAKDNGISNPPS